MRATVADKVGFQYPASRPKTSRALEMVGRGGRWNNFQVRPTNISRHCNDNINFRVPVVSSVQSKRAAQPSASAFYDIKASWKKMGAYLNGITHTCVTDVGELFKHV